MSEENDKNQIKGEGDSGSESKGNESKDGENKNGGNEPKQSPPPTKNNQILFKNKKMNAKSFSEMIGLNDRSKFWVNKKFDKMTIKTAGKWADIFIKEGVIHEKPSILEQKVNSSN